jgi:hypothetical protein
MVLCYASVLSDMTGLHRANTQDDIFHPQRNYSDPHSWCYLLSIKQPSERDRGISCCDCTRYCDKLSLIERAFTKSKGKDLGWNCKQKQALTILTAHHKMQTTHYLQSLMFYAHGSLRRVCLGNGVYNRKTLIFSACKITSYYMTAGQISTWW